MVAYIIEDQGWFPFALIGAYAVIAIASKPIGVAIGRWMRRIGRL